MYGAVKASGVRRCVRGCRAAVSPRVWNVVRLILGVAFLGNICVCDGSLFLQCANVAWAHIITGSSRLNSAITWQVWDNVPV